ncbi:hypothetical protein [Bosea sp. (in: a-proteobacteria)]|uniref:hypothetical protein n=1 Tax=Bosea sp. (in: a-proteobacteria) TaxID=1871050 RepID=UPI002FCB0E52
MPQRFVSINWLCAMKSRHARPRAMADQAAHHTLPAISLSIAVRAVNRLGGRLRDRLDPAIAKKAVNSSRLL